jgi:hypothetical protein
MESQLILMLEVYEDEIYMMIDFKNLSKICEYLFIHELK